MQFGNARLCPRHFENHPALFDPNAATSDVAATYTLVAARQLFALNIAFLTASALGAVTFA